MNQSLYITVLQIFTTVKGMFCYPHCTYGELKARRDLPEAAYPVGSGNRARK